MYNREPDVKTCSTKICAMVFAAATLMGSGCAGDDAAKVPDRREEGREVFKPQWAVNTPDIGDGGSGSTRVLADDAPKRSTWSILLGTFTGDGAALQAARALETARGEAGLSRAFVERRADGLALLTGSFEQGTSEEARQELAAVRRLRVGGETIYEAAALVPPAVMGQAGSIPEMDLRNARRAFGEKSNMTLQVAVYGYADPNVEPSAREREEFRQAAEEAARKLRSEGDQAFYYHGPRRSMVTVGLFETADLKDARVRTLRSKYPHNLVNGAPVKLGTGGRPSEQGSYQESFFVRVP